VLGARTFYDTVQTEAELREITEHLHPAWHAGRRFSVGPRPGVGVGRRISHVRVLLCNG